jgi:hypothetical protein
MSAEICAISRNLTDRALYANTVDRGQSFQFLETGYILATEKDYCLHSWEPNQIAAKQCIDFGRHTTTKHGPHKWMLTADPKENPLTPLMIINVDKNGCLTTDHNNNTIYLAPCNASAYQYYIFEHILPENSYFELNLAQETTISANGFLEFRSNTLNNQFGHAPQFYGNIFSRFFPEYCLSSLEDNSITIKLCKTSIFKTVYPQQEFSYYNKTLTSCVTPLITVICSDSKIAAAKWNYDLGLFTLTDSSTLKCLTVINDSTIGMAPCKSTNKNQQWDFQHNVITYPFPLEYIPTIKELKQKRDRSDRGNRRKPKIIETRTQQNTGPFPQNQTQPISSDAPNVPKLSNEDRKILSIENQQFVGAQAIKHET